MKSPRTPAPKAAPKPLARPAPRPEAEAGLPPYAGIDPARALKALGEPVGTADFAAAAEACAKGRADLVARGAAGGEARTLRRFSTWEVTRYLIPVATPHFRRVLKANPALPQGISEAEGGTRWFTLAEVNALRAHFAAEGSRAKEYKPWRPEGLPARIVTVANFKGGVGKTSTAAHLAMSAALDGYRVLVIDLDSQGSMTSIFGGRIDSEWDTVFPLLARNYAENLQAENRARAGRGETPLPFEDMLAEAMKLSARDVIRPTHWPSIDLIGAQLNLYWAEFQIPVWRMSSRGWKLWEALIAALDRDRVREAYDIILIDTPPALGYLTINGLTAADILLVPLGASFLEFDSTGRFFDMLHATFASIEEGENRAARALGLPETHFEWDAVRAILTRYDAGQQVEMASLMQGWMGRFMSRVRQDYTALIGQAGEQVKGIFEADYRDFNRDTYIRGRETFDATYAEMKRLVIGSWARAAQEAQGTTRAAQEAQTATRAAQEAQPMPRTGQGAA